VLVEGENLLCLCSVLRHTFAVLRHEIDHELGYNRGPLTHVATTPLDPNTAPPAFGEGAGGGGRSSGSSSSSSGSSSSSSSSSSSGSSGSSPPSVSAAGDSACVEAVAALRGGCLDSDLWALRASHVALLREGVVLVTQDLVRLRPSLVTSKTRRCSHCRSLARICWSLAFQRPSLLVVFFFLSAFQRLVVPNSPR
jgi:hypothetical protein